MAPRIETDSNYLPKMNKTFAEFLKRHADVIADYSFEPDGVFVSVTESSMLEDCHGSHTVRGDSPSDAMKKFRQRLRPLECKWFAMCNNRATSFRAHPVLDRVPICDRCNAKVAALEKR